MTATDELRALLDERGVEYETYTEPLTGIEHVKWNFNEHGSADFNIEFGAPWLTMHGTISGPAQAIEATLGRGTCKDMSGGDPCAFVCSECAAVCNHPYDEAIRYCPNCGRKVVDE